MYLPSRLREHLSSTRTTIERPQTFGRPSTGDPVAIRARIPYAPRPYCPCAPFDAQLRQLARRAILTLMTDSNFPQPIVFDTCCTAALTCFANNGFHGTSIRQIASEAGLSVPGLYHHYPSKAALLEKLCEVSMAELHAALKKASDTATTTLERFDNLVACLLEFHAVYGDVAFVTYSEIRALQPSPREQHIASRRAVEQVITEAVMQGAAEGLFSTNEPRHVSRAITHICLGVAQWFRQGGALSVDEIVAIYTTICRDSARYVDVSLPTL